MVGFLKSVAGAQNSLANVGKGSGGGASVGAATFERPGEFFWVVPEGVTNVCIVCVGAGGSLYSTLAAESSHVSRGATVLCRGVGGNSVDTPIRDGGGDQRLGAPGGYTANGNSGTGGAPSRTNQGTWQAGVGLWGEGPSGAVNMGEPGSGGSPRTSGVSGACGGGTLGSDNSSGPGGGLSWVNNVAVTPGETLTVFVGNTRKSISNQVSGAPGGVNIVWGRGNFPTLNGITFVGGDIVIGDPT